MLSYSKRNIIQPEFEQPVGFFFPIAVDAQVNTRSQGIDILRDAAGGIESFCVREIIYQLCKILCHFIRINRRAVLQSFPAILVFFDEKSFAQLERLRL